MSVTERSDAGAPPESGQPEGTPPQRPWWRQQPWLLVVVIAALAALVAAAVLIAVDDEDDEPVGTEPTTAPTPPTGSEAPTTEGPTGTTPPTSPTPDVAAAIFPSADSGVRFDDPVSAARAFAVDFIGFVDPVVGDFRQGDARSGEVDVRPTTSGPVTTVLVRQLGESWWVLGAATANIELRQPTAMATIASPVRLRGMSTAFEATVSVEVRQDGQREPIGTGFVMGGSMGELGPFDGTVTFSTPAAPMGAIVLYTVSMESGNVWEAAAVRVAFAGRNAGTPVPASACPDYSMPRPTPGPGQMVTTVFFSCGLDGTPVPTYRVVPATSGVLRSALEQLLAGPTAEERAAGLESWFSPATAGMLDDVVLRSGHATVDFHDLRHVIPKASTSAGSRLLLSQLDATVLQFPNVTSVTYRIDGEAHEFYEWLQHEVPHDTHEEPAEPHPEPGHD